MGSTGTVEMFAGEDEDLLCPVPGDTGRGHGCKGRLLCCGERAARGWPKGLGCLCPVACRDLALTYSSALTTLHS